MAKYNIGDKVALTLFNDDAYYLGLREELSPEELKVLDMGVKGYSMYLNYFCRKMKFYGKVTEIKEGQYSDGSPHRLIWFELSHGHKRGVFETNKDLRKANILEKIIITFKHSVKPLNKLATCN